MHPDFQKLNRPGFRHRYLLGRFFIFWLAAKQPTQDANLGSSGRKAKPPFASAVRKPPNSHPADSVDNRKSTGHPTQTTTCVVVGVGRLVVVPPATTQIGCIIVVPGAAPQNKGGFRSAVLNPD
jgi:hypothetical protein